MKINKFFMGAMCAVTLAMVGCEKTPDIMILFQKVCLS